MTDKVGLLDTNVIIDISKNLIEVSSIINEYNYLHISIITYIELLGFNFVNEDEFLIIKKIVDNLPISMIDFEIANFAIHYRKIRKIKLADSLIIATAKKLNAELITSNVSDFINIDNFVKVIKPTLII